MLFNNIYNIGFNVSVFNSTFGYYMYIYNKNYFLLIKLNIKDKKNNYADYNKIISGCVSTIFSIYIKQFILYTNNKIKFTGKGYKIKKNNKSNIMLLFNRAHITNISYFGVFLKKIKKYKLYVYGNYRNTVNMSQTIINIRYINIFTKKGLRFARQLVLKKKSKK